MGSCRPRGPELLSRSHARALLRSLLLTCGIATPRPCASCVSCACACADVIARAPRFDICLIVNMGYGASDP
eukprot:scaffold4632_cov25-Tisochrysis_lutea.AAC.1